MKSLILAVLLAQSAQQPVHIPVKSGTVINQETDQAQDVLGGIYLNDAAVMVVTGTIEELANQNAVLVQDLNQVSTQLSAERASPSKWVVAITVVAAVVASGLIAGAVGYGVGQAKGH